MFRENNRSSHELSLPQRHDATVSPEPDQFVEPTGYRDWVEHDFSGRAPAEEPIGSAQGVVVVEAPTDLVPIKALLEEKPVGSRRGCLMPSSGLAVPDFEADAEPEPEFDDAAIIRPYVRSGGRSEVKYDLQFETLVESTRPYASLPTKQLSQDQRHICRVCVVPKSVAEVAVAISAPLGLVRTILSDAIDRGYLRVHQTVSMVDGLPPADLLRRVYAGLARLSDVR